MLDPSLESCHGRIDILCDDFPEIKTHFSIYKALLLFAFICTLYVLSLLRNSARVSCSSMNLLNLHRNDAKASVCFAKMWVYMLKKKVIIIITPIYQYRSVSRINHQIGIKWNPFIPFTSLLKMLWMKRKYSTSWVSKRDVKEVQSRFFGTHVAYAMCFFWRCKKKREKNIEQKEQPTTKKSAKKTHKNENNCKFFIYLTARSGNGKKMLLWKII